MPKKPLNLLKNAASSAEKVGMQFNDSNARFDFDDVSISCLIEGNTLTTMRYLKDNPTVGRLAE